MVHILEQLKEVVDEAGVLTGDAVSDRIGVWGTNKSMQALALIRPQNTDQVSSILKLCNE